MVAVIRINVGDNSMLPRGLCYSLLRNILIVAIGLTVASIGFLVTALLCGLVWRLIIGNEPAPREVGLIPLAGALIFVIVVGQFVRHWQKTKEKDRSSRSDTDNR